MRLIATAEKKRESVYVCMYVRTYECIVYTIHVCIYVCMHVCMYVFMYVCIYLCMYVRMCVCVYVCMYVCNRVFLQPKSPNHNQVPHPQEKVAPSLTANLLCPQCKMQ